MIDELISDAGGSGLRTMSSDDLAEGHGNYAGDQPVNLGGVSVKMIQAGDTVRYIDQKAQVVDMSPDRKYSRITIPSSSTTKTVLTSDLRQLGQGMAETDDQQLDELNLKDLGSKIFGSKAKSVAPTQAAASGGAQRQAYVGGINPDTQKPWTGDELRAEYFPTAPATTGTAMPTTPLQIPGAVTNPVKTTAPTTTAATKSATTATTATTAAGTFPGEDPQGAGYVGRLEVARRQAARNAQAAKNPATPNAAGTIGTYNKKTGAATLGDKSMLAFKDLPPNIQKQLAGITEALAQPVAELLQMVETKEDVQRIKKFIDDTFVKHGAVNESAFVVRNQILEHVTQVGAQRRRDFAAQQAH
jgi:hypothetical protein